MEACKEARRSAEDRKHCQALRRDPYRGPGGSRGDQFHVGPPACRSAAGLTGVHHGLPLAAPLAELLGVQPLHTGPLLETRHDVVTRLEGVFCALHGALVVPRLWRQREEGEGTEGGGQSFRDRNVQIQDRDTPHLLSDWDQFPFS